MGRAKDAERAADSSRQREEVQAIGNQFAAQLVPGSEELAQLLAEIQQLAANVDSPASEQDLARELGQRLVSQQQSRIAAGGPASPLEARTNKAFEGLREVAKPVDFEQDIFNILNGDPTTTDIGTRLVQGTKPTGIEQELLDALTGAGIETPIGGIFEQTINRANAPTIDDSVFRNALKLVEDRVNSEAAGRGTLGSGLRLEQLGRAGVDASIAEGQRQDRLRQEAYANALGLFDTGRNVESGIRDFSSGLFNTGEGLRERQLGIERSLVDMQLGRETNLTGQINNNTNTRLNDLSSLLQRRTDRAQEVSDFERILQENNQRSIRQALGGGLGTIAGTLIPGVGPSAGASLGGGIAGGGSVPNLQRTVTAPQSVPDYLNAQRNQTGTRTTGTGTTNLSRQSSLDDEQLRKLLAVLGGSF